MIKFESKPAWSYLLQLIGDKLYNYFYTLFKQVVKNNYVIKLYMNSLALSYNRLDQDSSKYVWCQIVSL